METAKLILDYLKVWLSPQVIFSAAAVVFFILFRQDIKALLARVGSIKFPGGTKVSMSQKERQEEGGRTKELPETVSEASASDVMNGLTEEQRKKIGEVLSAWKKSAYLWEYRYLNYFLVPSTLNVLNWLVEAHQGNQPVTVQLFDSSWLPWIPSAQEREAILAALEMHRLVRMDNGVIKVTEKGLEYHQWRRSLR